jgi:hypothetical protein
LKNLAKNFEDSLKVLAKSLWCSWPSYWYFAFF